MAKKTENVKEKNTNKTKKTSKKTAKEVVKTEVPFVEEVKPDEPVSTVELFETNTIATTTNTEDYGEDFPSRSELIEIKNSEPEPHSEPSNIVEVIDNELAKEVTNEISKVLNGEISLPEINVVYSEDKKEEEPEPKPTVFKAFKRFLRKPPTKKIIFNSYTWNGANYDI